MEIIQQTLTVVFVLGLLGGTLYWLRSKGLAQFRGGIKLGGAHRMKSIERLVLTPQHSLHLVVVSGRVLLIAVSPGGCSVLDNEIPMEEKRVAQ
jgi:flagellar biogenesis protein FliO